MTIHNVPDSPPSVDESGIRSGKPVKSATQWLSMAEAANYLNSHEMTLVSSTGYADPITSSISPAVANCWFLTRQQVRRVLWVFTFRAYKAESSAFSVWGTVQVGTGVTYAFSISSSGDEMSEPLRLFYLEDRSQTSTPYYQYVTITRRAGNASIIVDQISAFQVRRYGIETSEDGVDLMSCKPGAIIMDKSSYSVDGVTDAITTAKENCRRASMFTWSSPIASGIRVGQGSSWNTLFHEKPEVLARYITSGVTETSVAINILAATASAATAHIRFVADSGDSATIDVLTVLGATWYATTVLIHTEASATANRRGSVADRIEVAVYGNGNTVQSDGVFALRLYTICIGES